ncbi:MAG: hypothetical protein ACOC44_18850 [Promethearchaeia archaeon]
MEKLEISDIYEYDLADSSYVVLMFTALPISALAVGFIIYPSLKFFLYPGYWFILGFLELFIVIVGTHSLKKDLKSELPPYKVKGVFDYEKICFYIQDHLFFRIFWREIEKIYTYKEKVSLYSTKYNFRLHFFHPNGKPRSIRLHVLNFRKKNRAKIVSFLHTTANKLNKEFNFSTEIKEPKPKSLNEEFEKVYDFRVKFREENLSQIRRKIVIDSVKLLVLFVSLAVSFFYVLSLI